MFYLNALLFCMFWVLIVLFPRVIIVGEIRSKFIFTPVLFEKYFLLLPSMTEMIFHPKHYGRWSYTQWLEYVYKIAKETKNV